MELIKIPNPKAESPEALEFKRTIDAFQADYERKFQERGQALLRAGYEPGEAEAMARREFSRWWEEIVRMRVAWNDLFGSTPGVILSKEEAEAAGLKQPEPPADG